MEASTAQQIKAQLDMIFGNASRVVTNLRAEIENSTKRWSNAENVEYRKLNETLTRYRGNVIDSILHMQDMLYNNVTNTATSVRNIAVQRGGKLTRENKAAIEAMHDALAENAKRMRTLSQDAKSRLSSAFDSVDTEQLAIATAYKKMFKEQRAKFEKLSLDSSDVSKQTLARAQRNLYENLFSQVDAATKRNSAGHFENGDEARGFAQKFGEFSTAFGQSTETLHQHQKELRKTIDDLQKTNEAIHNKQKDIAAATNQHEQGTYSTQLRQLIHTQADLKKTQAELTATIRTERDEFVALCQTVGVTRTDALNLSKQAGAAASALALTEVAAFNLAETDNHVSNTRLKQLRDSVEANDRFKLHLFEAAADFKNLHGSFNLLQDGLSVLRKGVVDSARDPILHASITDKIKKANKRLAVSLTSTLTDIAAVEGQLGQAPQHIAAIFSGMKPAEYQKILGQHYNAIQAATGGYKGVNDYMNNLAGPFKDLYRLSGNNAVAAGETALKLRELQTTTGGVIKTDAQLQVGSERYIKQLRNMRDHMGMTAEEIVNWDTQIATSADGQEALALMTLKERSQMFENINARAMEAKQIGLSAEQAKKFSETLMGFNKNDTRTRLKDMSLMMNEAGALGATKMQAYLSQRMSSGNYSIDTKDKRFLEAKQEMDTARSKSLQAGLNDGAQDRTNVFETRMSPAARALIADINTDISKGNKENPGLAGEKKDEQGGVATTVGNAISSVKTTVSAVAGSLAANTSALFANTAALVASTYLRGDLKVLGKWGDPAELFKKFGKGGGGAAGGAGNLGGKVGLGSRISGALSSGWNGVTGAGSRVLSGMGGLGTRISGALGSGWNGVAGAGSRVLSGMSGIGSKAAGVMGDAAAVTKAVGPALGKILGPLGAAIDVGTGLNDLANGKRQKELHGLDYVSPMRVGMRTGDAIYTNMEKAGFNDWLDEVTGLNDKTRAAMATPTPKTVRKPKTPPPANPSSLPSSIAGFGVADPSRMGPDSGSNTGSKYAEAKASATTPSTPPAPKAAAPAAMDPQTATNKLLGDINNQLVLMTSQLTSVINKTSKEHTTALYETNARSRDTIEKSLLRSKLKSETTTASDATK